VFCRMRACSAAWSSSSDAGFVAAFFPRAPFFWLGMNTGETGAGEAHGGIVAGSISRSGGEGGWMGMCMEEGEAVRGSQSCEGSWCRTSGSGSFQWPYSSSCASQRSPLPVLEREREARRLLALEGRDGLSALELRRRRGVGATYMRERSPATQHKGGLTGLHTNGGLSMSSMSEPL
jgi:hypothetical protein